MNLNSRFRVGIEQGAVAFVSPKHVPRSRQEDFPVLDEKRQLRLILKNTYAHRRRTYRS